MVEDGFRVFDSDPKVLRWAEAACKVARDLAADAAVRRANLRHRGTWFVGVDALPNNPDGSIGGVPLAGPFAPAIHWPEQWHRAQLSIVFPGYPRQDPDESDAAHRFRHKRYAAHVDGLLPIGPDRRRYLREPHAFILGLPLNDCDAAPLVVWPGSQRVMGEALRHTIGRSDPTTVDLTDDYQAARRRVFETIAPMPVRARPGQAILLHRHLLHGVAPWGDMPEDLPEGRMIAYLRPQYSASRWCGAD